MAKFSLKSLVPKKSAGKAKLEIRYVFLAILVVVLVLDAWVIWNAVSVALDLQNQTAPSALKGNGVRLDFTDYNAIIKRMQSASTFQPTGGLAKDPFSKNSTLPPSTPPVNPSDVQAPTSSPAAATSSASSASPTR